MGSLRYRGKEYYSTGKSGTNNATGVKVYEYEAVDDDGRRTGERIWVDARGNIYPD